jgi:mannose-6-phosphate isomerase-like protein (cupin superfamily)
MNPTTHRVWGHFSDLFQDDNVKVKELVIEPGAGISYQRHFNRSELWFVSQGSCFIRYSPGDPEDSDQIELTKYQMFTVPVGCWHQAYNTGSEPCHIVEIQYGTQTVEEDIERLEYYQNA